MHSLIAALLATMVHASPSAPDSARIDVAPASPDVASNDTPRTDDDSTPLEAAFTEPAAQAAAANAKPLNKWSGSLSFGGSWSDGNTVRRAATSLVDAEYRREKDRFNIKFLWNYADENHVLTERRTYGSFKYDYFLSKKSYLFGIAEGENSFSAHYQLRTALGGGYGFQFIETKELKLAIELGAVWFREDFSNADPTKEYPAGRAAYNAEWKPTDKLTIANDGEFYQGLDDKTNASARELARGRYNFTERFFIELAWIFAWDNAPATGSKRVDNLYTLNVGWGF